VEVTLPNETLDNNDNTLFDGGSSGTGQLRAQTPLLHIEEVSWAEELEILHP